MNNDFQEAVEFLIENVPLNEMGTELANLAEMYRYKTITKKQAIELCLTKHKQYINKFVQTKNELLEEFGRFDSVSVF